MTPNGRADMRNLLAGSVTALNAAKYGEAECLLERILIAEPDNPVALYMMGVAKSEQGHWSVAETYLKQALALAPANTDVLLALAKALRALKRPAEAVPLCQNLLVGEGKHLGAFLELAKAFEESDNIEAAAATYRNALHHFPESVVAALAFAALLNGVGNHAEAESVLKAAMRHDVESHSLRYQLAATLKLQRRYAEGLVELEAASTDPKARHFLPVLQNAKGELLQHLGRFEEAITAYESIISEHPIHLDAHRNLNELLYRLGRDDEFLQSYDKALKRAPDSHTLLSTRGEFLLKANRTEEALESFQRASAIAPQERAVLSGVARALEALGRTGLAEKAYAENLALAQHEPDALVDMAGFFLRTGRPSEALSAAARAHALQVDHQSAMALMGLSYRALQDEREFELNGYKPFIREFELDAPDGFGDMETFNKALLDYLDSLQVDKREYFTQTLRGGTRAFDSIFFNGHTLADRLWPKIAEAIAIYAAELGNGDHPFVARRRRTFSVAGSWSSRLSDCGYHLNHIHAAGWISCCYYVAVPDVAQDEKQRQGWIKFGEPTADFGDAFTPRRVIQPRPGHLVLFPSYMWHGTIPFHSPQTRTTIAFDVIPRPD